MKNDLRGVFGDSGKLSKLFDNYESRPEQLEMAQVVNNAMVVGKHAVVEGATGVGKTLAYLVPIILSEKKTIISTSNKSLQDQISLKDLPMLNKCLKTKVSWATLKGRNNYFCPQHFQVNRRELKLILDGADLKKLGKWAAETTTGDVEHYPGELPRAARELVTCDTYTRHDKESVFNEMCFANKARIGADKADILLVNHTLLALNLALLTKTEGKVSFLPKAEIVVIDEAHTFESRASKAFSDRINIFTINHLVNWKEVTKSTKKSERDALKTSFEKALSRYTPEKKGEYYQQLPVEKFEGFSDVIAKVDAVVAAVNKNGKLKEDETGKARVLRVATEGRRLSEKLRGLQAENDNLVRWTEAKKNKYGKVLVSMRSEPISISELLEEELLEKSTVVCTSATLTTNGNFDFFKDRLGIPDSALELAVGSPFDYKENSLVYISSGEDDQIWEVSRLVKASGGGAFVLFTSYKDMNRFYEQVETPYPKLVQTAGTSRLQLLKQFKASGNAVLFATKSFWEGVDVQGDGLRLVIVHKIPFENPSDLVFSARCKLIDEQHGKGKHWSKYTIPLACLSLKQGVGRLIRSKTDTGVIALLDPRINYKGYGKSIIKVMPPAHRTQKLENVERFYKWLAKRAI